VHHKVYRRGGPSSLGDIMADLEETLIPIVRSTLSEVLNAEGLVTEAMRDLVRDEIKAYMRAKLEDDPVLKQEIKDALEMYLESRAKEMLATVRLAKAGTKMSFAMLPDNLKEEIKAEIVGIFEAEIAEFLERV
jgi:hypothetical protein